MKDLKCTCSNCELNNNCHCEAGIINIASNGVCKTKIKKHLDNIDDEYSKMESAMEYDENADVMIQCDDICCKYNKDHMCNASCVNIKDTMTKTKCVTRCDCK